MSPNHWCCATHRLHSSSAPCVVLCRGHIALNTGFEQQKQLGRLCNYVPWKMDNIIARLHQDSNNFCHIAISISDVKPSGKMTYWLSNLAQLRPIRTGNPASFFWYAWKLLAELVNLFHFEPYNFFLGSY